MTPAEKEARLKRSGVRMSVEVVEVAVRKLRESGSTYSLYSSDPPLMSKRSAEKIRRMYDERDLDFLMDQAALVVEPEGHEPAGQYHWPNYSASDLASVFAPKSIANIMLLLESTRQENDNRLHRFVEGLISKKESAGEIPESWLACIVGFPIIATEVPAPGFLEMANLMETNAPYLHKNLRLEFRKRAKSILHDVWQQVSWWAAPSGHMLMPSMPMPAISVNSFTDLAEFDINQIPEDIRIAERDSAEDSLVNGKTLLYHAHGAPPIEQTNAGVLLDILSRLPDVDRRHGKVFGKKLGMTGVMILWCSTR